MAGASAPAKNPKNVTLYGRLSFPVFSYTAAVERNAKSNYPRPADEVAPEFHMLLEQAQYDKFKDHVTNVFLPNCLKRSNDGEKKDALNDKEIKRVLAVFKDLENQPPYIPAKPMSEKTAELAPECVVSLKVVGVRGQDIVQKAIVTAEDQLTVPDPDIIWTPDYRTIKPINETVHQLFPGCYVAATLNLYAYISGSAPGFSASAGTIVFRNDGDRFGGGVAIDEDDIFDD
jgi:hypothetical protein